MLLTVGNKEYHFSSIVIYNDNIILDKNKKIKLNKKVAIEVEEGPIYLDSLYHSFIKIKNREKIKNIEMVIIEDYEGMDVQTHYIGQQINFITVSMSLDMLKNFDNDVLLVFLSHEIGHVLDFNFNLKSIKFNRRMFSFFKYINTLIIPILFWYFFSSKYNSYLRMIGFLSISLSFSYVSVFFLTYLKAWYSRTMEYTADKYAVLITKDVNLVISSLRQLMDYIGDENEEAGILDSHPSIKQRVKYLEFRFWFSILLQKMFK